MEQIRTIRIVLAPFILLGSLLLGGWIDGKVTLHSLHDLSTQSLTALGGIIAASIVPAGFVIGGLTNALLWLCHQVTWHKWDRFELSLTEDAWKKIWDRCGFKPSRDSKNTRVWGATIWIRSQVNERVHEISDRRYQAAAAHLNACVAVVTSWGVGWWALEYCAMWKWVTLTGGLAALFVLLAFVARWEASELLEILAHQDEGKAGLTQSGRSSAV